MNGLVNLGVGEEKMGSGTMLKVTFCPSKSDIIISIASPLDIDRAVSDYVVSNYNGQDSGIILYHESHSGINDYLMTGDNESYVAICEPQKLLQAKQSLVEYAIKDNETILADKRKELSILEEKIVSFKEYKENLDVKNDGDWYLVYLKSESHISNLIDDLSFTVEKVEWNEKQTLNDANTNDGSIVKKICRKDEIDKTKRIILAEAEQIYTKSLDRHRTEFMDELGRKLKIIGELRKERNKLAKKEKEEADEQ